MKNRFFRLLPALLLAAAALLLSGCGNTAEPAEETETELLASLGETDWQAQKFSIVGRFKEVRKKKGQHSEDSPLDEVIEDDGPMELTREEAEG